MTGKMWIGQLAEVPKNILKHINFNVFMWVQAPLFLRTYTLYKQLFTSVVGLLAAVFMFTAANLVTDEFIMACVNSHITLSSTKNDKGVI